MQKLSEQEQQKRMQVTQLANMVLPACVQALGVRHQKDSWMYLDETDLSNLSVSLAFTVAKRFFLEIHAYMGEPEIYKAPAGMN